ncbi:MAG: SDR family oxidoreductase [Proteobacteria bacterium]|nr:SDR family oxidoreductase [Pseudomonadota bacterium]
MDLGLKGKTIMVAAGSRGLGLGIARQVAKEGACVSIAAPTEPRVHESAAKLRDETGASVISAVMDARDHGSILKWRDDTLDAFESIDGLVVNAGGPPAGLFDDFDDADWASAFELTLLSAVRMIRAVLPSLRSGQSGSIVTVTSSSVKEPIDMLLLSNVMRSGVTSLAKSLSRQLAGEGIRVNNLVPGAINTDRLRGLMETQAARTGEPFKKLWDSRAATVPLGRFGEPDEFGQAGAFLLSDAAAYITGETLIVDGGAMKTVW